MRSHSLSQPHPGPGHRPVPALFGRLVLSSLTFLLASCGSSENEGQNPGPGVGDTTTGVTSTACSTGEPTSSAPTSGSSMNSNSSAPTTGSPSTGLPTSPSTTVPPVSDSTTSSVPTSDPSGTEETTEDSSGFGSSTSGGETSGPLTSEPPPPPSDAKDSPNLFTELAGKSQAEVDAKVETAVNRFFGIGTNEPNTPTQNSGYRCYYDSQTDDSMAFIWAADSNDIRSEGQSYGMMVAVQMDLKTEFDKLWRFAKAKMQYPANTQYAAWKYYFKWQGFPAGNDWDFGAATVPAPDGDEYFAAALYFADQRWGSDGEINYKQEADNIATALLHNSATGDGRFPIFHATQRMIVFVPYGNSNEFTDPSYHLPAFYEMFALYGPSADANTWKQLAEISREYLVKSAHPSTGLHPDYATFAGAPTTGSPGDGHDQFRYDAWRVVMNMGMDYVWFSRDARMKSQAEKYHSFFAAHLGQDNVTNALFAVDGSGASGGSSTALTATLAAGAMASEASNRLTYVDNLWNVPQQQGQYRYYQESVYLLGLLNVAGKFNYAW